jgi:histidinol-phosphate aminotransferase
MTHHPRLARPQEEAMPRYRHDAYDIAPSPFQPTGGGRLSRRDVLGGVLSAAALGLVGTSEARAAGVGAAISDVRRTTTALRLGSNENPCGLGPAAKDAFLSALAEANRYPGRSSYALVEALAALHKVDTSWIYLAPGSGELLRAGTTAFTSPSKALVMASPTFEAPGRTAMAVGAPVHEVPVTSEGRLDLDAMAAKAAGAGLFFLCNPNNPTGGSVPGTAVAEFVAKVKMAAPEARVLVDEAYFDYVEDPGYATAVPLAQADPRVFVTRTFSKIFGMAGLRVGYAIGHPETLAALRQQGSSGTLSSASLAAAAAALGDTAHLTAEKARNRATRTFTRERFEAAGYRVLPSSANFLMIDVRRDASSFGSICRQHQIFVARAFPPLTSCVRLTIGTQAEMDEAVPAMLALLEAPASARAHSIANDWEAEAAC